MTQGGGPARLRNGDWMLRTLREAGFSPGLIYHAFHILESYVLGYTLQQLNFPYKGEELAGLAADFLKQIPVEDYPDLVEHSTSTSSRTTRRRAGSSWGSTSSSTASTAPARPPEAFAAAAPSGRLRRDVSTRRRNASPPGGRRTRAGHLRAIVPFTRSVNRASRVREQLVRLRLRDPAGRDRLLQLLLLVGDERSHEPGRRSCRGPSRRRPTSCRRTAASAAPPRRGRGKPPRPPGGGTRGRPGRRGGRAAEQRVLLRRDPLLQRVAFGLRDPTGGNRRVDAVRERLLQGVAQLGGLDAEVLGRVVDHRLAVFLLRAAGCGDRCGSAGGHRQGGDTVATILRFIELLPSNQVALIQHARPGTGSGPRLRVRCESEARAKRASSLPLLHEFNRGERPGIDPNSA